MANLPEDVRVVRDAIAHVDGLRCNSDGMLSYESAAKVAAAALAAYPPCMPAEHVEAARSGAFAEAAQLLHTRWRSAWDSWTKLLPSDETEPPSEECRRAWAHMEHAHEAYESIAALQQQLTR